MSRIFGVPSEKTPIAGKSPGSSLCATRLRACAVPVCVPVPSLSASLCRSWVEPIADRGENGARRKAKALAFAAANGSDADMKRRARGRHDPYFRGFSVPQAPKSGAYSHQAAPDMSGAGGDAKPSGAGPRGKVVDADYTETR